jgi:hypothetical protein
MISHCGTIEVGEATSRRTPIVLERSRMVARYQYINPPSPRHACRFFILECTIRHRGISRVQRSSTIDDKMNSSRAWACFGVLQLLSWANAKFGHARIGALPTLERGKLRLNEDPRKPCEGACIAVFAPAN